MYGKNTADHNKNLRAVLKRLSDVHLTLNKKKCLFNQSSIKFFGYIFSKDGMKSDLAKVECLHKMPLPENVNELRSFLGMANYSANFVKNFAALTVPLRELTRKGTKWELSKTEHDTFKKVEESLSADTITTYYEIGQATDVIIDGSPLGQQQKSEVEGFKVVMFVSRALTPVEKDDTKVRLNGKHSHLNGRVNFSSLM